MGEFYCKVFHDLHGLETYCLRYFNVFGPRQDPLSPYAAVIPLFIREIIAGTPLTVYGDGEQTRDFTFVQDVVSANQVCARAPAHSAGQTYNVAMGRRTSVNSLAQKIGNLLERNVKPSTCLATFWGSQRLAGGHLTRSAAAYLGARGYVRRGSSTNDRLVSPNTSMCLLSVQDLDDLMVTAKEAARAAGDHAYKNLHRRGEVHAVGTYDVKLVLDVECQRLAERVIAGSGPGELIAGEEDGQHRINEENCWIIDPLDGTVNYHHGLPYWCTSVAVRRNGKIVVGVVYAPALEACFTAHLQQASQLNNETIHTSNVDRLDRVSDLNRHVAFKV